VYHALEGTLCLVDCIDGSGACEMIKSCPTRDTWEEMTEAIKGVLQRTTLRDLKERQTKKTGFKESMYYI